MVWPIFKREFSSYWNSPIAYIFISVYLLIAGVFFFYIGSQVLSGGEVSLRNYFFWLQFMMFFFVPAVAMRVWSEEFQTGTIEILLTMPAKTIEVIVGKFLGAFGLLMVVWALSVWMALVVGSLGIGSFDGSGAKMLRDFWQALDWGVVASGYLGLILSSMALLAVSIFFSSLTPNQITAFILSLIVCLALTVIGWQQFYNVVPENVGGIPLRNFFEQLSVLYQSEGFMRGVVGLQPIAYFLGLTGFGLFLNYVRIESLRQG